MTECKSKPNKTLSVALLLFNLISPNLERYKERWRVGHFLKPTLKSKEVNLTRSSYILKFGTAVALKRNNVEL